jgi:GDP-mannose 6-dehydrogenase
MDMRVSVFGLGYVGCVSAACFARLGHHVVGVDVAKTKVDLINAGQTPIIEDDIGDIITEVVASGRLSATTDAVAAIEQSDISLVCVGTPSRKNGSLDLSYIQRVSEEIGRALASKEGKHTVAIRRTVLPGTIDDVVIPALESAGLRVPEDVGVAANPEFLREGTSVADFFDPPFTVIGTHDEDAGAVLSKLYEAIEAPLHVTEVKVAEMIKYASNCYHGLKISFANEMGNLAKALDVDSHLVMDLFAQDEKLNVSRAYLRPGFAFGGSCLPKDIRAAVSKGNETDVPLPLLAATLASNDLQVSRAGDMVLGAGNRRIGILGMSFKEGTDDLRESPMVRLIEFLIGKGMELAIYDQNVKEAGLVGANKSYIEAEIPHIWSLMKPDLDEVIGFGDTIIVGHNNREFRTELQAVRNKVIVDLVRLWEDRDPDLEDTEYLGICW